MLDKINTERHGHILTIEDPIEYIHSTQELPGEPARGPQRHRRASATALRAALREDPDVVLHRRDARPRDRSRRRSRSPRPGTSTFAHAAHELGGADHQPHHRHLSGRPAGADPDAALARAGGDSLPGAAAAHRRPGPRAVARDPGADAGDPGRSSGTTRSTRSTAPCRRARKSSACRPRNQSLASAVP